MSNYNYLPIPPRVWSRVQNQCTYTDVSGNSDINYQQVYIPLTDQVVPQGQADYEKQMFYKGNILQYKANSARFTKAEKYSRLAKMQGPNRTKVFATQSQTYTNPNTTGLLRVNYSTYPYPNQIVGVPNNISGPFAYNIQNPNDCSGNSVQDGGNLVCGTYANPCTGEIIQQGPKTATICNSASASDVPGSSTLCWNNNIQTFFPRSRYTMNNSGTKWPINYKGFVSAVTPSSPILLDAIGGCGTVELYWSYSFNSCVPITNFNVYMNGLLIATVPYTLTSFTVENLYFNTNYSFYVTSLSNSTESDISNPLSVTTLNVSPPTNLSATSTCESVNLNWESNGVCLSGFYIYINGTFDMSVLYPNTSATILNLEPNTTYSFYVKSYSGGYYSDSSNTISLTTNPLNTPTLSIDSYITTPSPGVILNFAPGTTGCTTTSYSYNLYTSINSGTYTFINISGDGTNPQQYTVNLSYSNIYNFYITYVDNNGNESAPSSVVGPVNTVITAPTNLTATALSPTTATLNWTSVSSQFVTSYTISGSTSGSTNSTSYSLTGLSGNTPYTYYVVANYNTYSSSSVSTNLTTSQYINITSIPSGYSVYTNLQSTSGTGNYYYMFAAGGGAFGGTTYVNPSANIDLGLLYNFTVNYNFSPNYIVCAGGGTGVFLAGSGGAGGGGGGVIQNGNGSYPLYVYITGTTYTISVGGYGSYSGGSAYENGGASSIGIGTNGQQGVGTYIIRTTGGTSGIAGGTSGGGTGSIINGSVYSYQNGGGGGNNSSGTQGQLIYLPYSINGSTAFFLGGGGGGSFSTLDTGYAGYGYGGGPSGADTSSATGPIGFIASYTGSSPNYGPYLNVNYFGGGGGGGALEGNGSTGVVILYWSQ